MSKIVAFYYTQTGQGLDILRSVCRPPEDAGHEVIYKAIVPEKAFPFPWTSDEFFHVFPDAYRGVPCPLRDIDLSDAENADLVIIEYPVWFLSASIPTHAFFNTPAVRRFLKDKPVVAISGCRNMWAMAHLAVSACIDGCGGKLVGHIALQDRHHNLISVITTVRWLICGRKEKKGFFPAAGVSPDDVTHAAVFGRTIAGALHDGEWAGLQQKLMQNNAVCYRPGIVFLEKNGHRIFGLWARFVSHKDANRRAFRLKLFKYYLFAVLYLVSPVGMFLFYLTLPFRCKAIRKDRIKLTGLSHEIL
ncbi:MAG: hypothetical protein LBF89_00830 [Bacteroidales bacterium]|jgi:hypothetical protein|nr:hypothetical protein [Bacteroidales bacterium]